MNSVWALAWTSVRVAALAALLAAPLGLLLGWATARWRGGSTATLNTLLVVPAPVVLYCFLAAEPGWVWMTLLGVVSAAPLMAWTVSARLGEAMQSTEIAARTLTTSEWKIFVKLLLPPLKPYLVPAAALMFARVLAECVVGLAVRR